MKLLIISGIVLLIIYLPGYVKIQKLKTKQQALLAKVEEIREENANLSEQVKMLEKDPVYGEKKAREKLGLSRKGEIIYRVITTRQKADE